MNHKQTSRSGRWPGSRRNIWLLVFLAIIGFFLFTEDRAQLFRMLPYLLLLACPLMHFLHRGHGGDSKH